MENKYSLYHYGIKGMRWGRRKSGIVSDNPKGRFDLRKMMPGGGKITNTHKPPKNAKVDGASTNPAAKRKAIGKKIAIAAFAAWGATVTINTIKDYRAGDPSTRFAIDAIKDIFSKR